MKTIAKVAIGALMACGIAAATVAPADAGVRIGVGIGVPVVAAGYSPGICYDRFGMAYHCAYPGYYGPVSGGVWIGGHGGWRHGGWDHRDGHLDGRHR